MMSWRSGGGMQESILAASIIPLAVIVGDELCDGLSKRGLTEEDHPAQTLRFHCAHEPFGERVQIRWPRRKPNEADAFANQDATKLIRVLCISIENEISLAAK